MSKKKSVKKTVKKTDKAKAKDVKDKELTDRQKIDKNKKLTDYEKAFAKVEAARHITSDKYWLEGYAQRTKEKDEAFKHVQDFAKKQATSINHKTDITGLKKLVVFVEKACERLDEYRIDMVRDVEELNHVCSQKLFKDDMPKDAKYNFKTGAVEIIKNL